MKKGGKIKRKNPLRITLNKTSARLWKGQSFAIYATCADPIEWESSDSAIAIVDQNGAIKAVSKGKATIFARLQNDRNITATVAIEVVEIKQIAASGYNSAIVDSNGYLYEAGPHNHDYGGRDLRVFTNNAFRLIAGKTAMVAVGNNYMTVLTTEGKIYGTGYYGNGQLGNGDMDLTDWREPFVPAADNGFADIKAIFTGSGICATAALDKNNDLWLAGDNIFGEPEKYSKFSRIASNIKAVAFGMGRESAIVIDEKGDIKIAAGRSLYGGLGAEFVGKCVVSAFTDAAFEEGKPSGASFEIAASGSFALALDTTSGDLYLAGIYNDTKDWGTLYGKDMRIKGSPKHGIRFDSFHKMPDLNNIVGNYKKAFAGDDRIFAIDQDDNLWATGGNTHGELGTSGAGDDDERRFVFTRALKSADPNDFLTNIVAVATGEVHTLALDKNGVLWGAGSNERGQLGFGNDATIEKIEDYQRQLYIPCSLFFRPIPLPKLN